MNQMLEKIIIIKQDIENLNDLNESNKQNIVET